MEFVKPDFEILEQDYNDANGYKKQIEKVGRLCYKSLDKITENSYEGFVDRMKRSKHGAMLEHGTIYLQFSVENGETIGHYIHNKFSKCNIVNNIAYVTTNYRVIVENHYDDDLQYMCRPTEYHERRYAVKFKMDRIGSQSCTRHRVFSFAQESTRYCNYSKDKFKNEIKVSLPDWISENDVVDYDRELKFYEAFMRAAEKKTLWQRIKNVFKPASYFDDFDDIDFWLFTNKTAEVCYLNLIKKGWTAQQARSVLPCDLATEFVMTGFMSDWVHFFNLRSLGTTGAPHPDIKALADKLKDEFIKRGYILEDMLGKE